MKYIQTKTIMASIVLLIAAAPMVFGWGSSGGFGDNASYGGGYSSGGFSVGPSGNYGYTNVDDQYGNPVGVGMAGPDYGGGDDWGGGGGSWCSVESIPCVSAENSCGMVAGGTYSACAGSSELSGYTTEEVIDMYYNGIPEDLQNVGVETSTLAAASCSADVPPLPEFEINGETKTVGDSCTVTDPCGRSVTGVVGCDGRCNVETFTTCTPPPEPTTDPAVGIPTVVVPDEEPEQAPFTIPTAREVGLVRTTFPTTPQITIVTPQGTPPDWQTEHTKKYVAIHAFPRIVRTDGRAVLVIYTIGLNSCDIRSSDGYLWKKVGKDNPLGVSYVWTQKLRGETTFTVERCYTIDQDGYEIIYTPTDTDNASVTIPVAPAWKER